jgi:large subunit ribosomal protein L31
MKKNQHPTTQVISSRCVCGKTYDVLSTQEQIVVSFCSACHPYYTNKQQFADTEGRIQKFNKRYKAPSA